MTSVEIASFVVSFSLGASRLLKTAAPLWDKLPKVIAVALPVVVLTLPKIAELFGVVHTDLDLVDVSVVSLAMLIPGVAAAEANK